MVSVKQGIHPHTHVVLCTVRTELNGFLEKANEQSKMDGVAAGFLQTKLRDMEEKLLKAHSEFAAA